MNMLQFQPRDIIAILVLVTAVFLIFNGIDSPLTELISLAVGYYFGNKGNDTNSRT